MRFDDVPQETFQNEESLPPAEPEMQPTPVIMPELPIAQAAESQLVAPTVPNPIMEGTPDSEMVIDESIPMSQEVAPADIPVQTVIPEPLPQQYVPPPMEEDDFRKKKKEAQPKQKKIRRKVNKLKGSLIKNLIVIKFFCLNKRIKLKINPCFDILL